MNIKRLGRAVGTTLLKVGGTVAGFFIGTWMLDNYPIALWGFLIATLLVLAVAAAYVKEGE